MTVNSSSRIMLGSIALEPNRWADNKVPANELIELVEPTALAGFTAMEVWEYHATGLADSELAEVGNIARDVGVSFPSMACYPDLLPGTADLKDYIHTVVSRAAQLRVERLKIFGGNRPSASLSTPERAESIASLNLLSSKARAFGISVSVELHGNTLCDSVEAAQRTLEDADDISICFQPLDFTDTGQTIADFSTLADSVDHIHLQGRRSGDFSLLEHADIDYRAFFNSLTAHNYSGDLCIEFVDGCIVEHADDFDLETVLETATKDRDFVDANYIKASTA